MTVGPRDRRNDGHPRWPVAQLRLLLSSRITEYLLPSSPPLMAALVAPTSIGPLLKMLPKNVGDSWPSCTRTIVFPVPHSIEMSAGSYPGMLAATLACTA